MDTVDVLIVGGGVSGASAAASAASLGAEVVMVEKTEALGGAASLSNGSVWTFDDSTQFLARCPGAPEWLANMVTQGLADARTWLQSLGLELVSKTGGSIYGARRSDLVDVGRLAFALDRAVSEGMAVIRGDAVLRLIRERDGTLVFETEKGRRGRAKAVVLATGGIHADTVQLSEAGLGRFAGFSVRNRSVIGDGLRFARELGAARDGSGAGIYGHLVPAGLKGASVLSPFAAQYQSKAGVIISSDGSLLSPLGTDDHDVNRALAQQRNTVAALIFDSNACVGPSSSTFGPDRVAFAREHGCRALTTTGLDEVLNSLVSWGYPPPTGEALEALHSVLLEAPFHLIEVAPSMTHAGVGIRVGENLHAQDVNGTDLAGLLVAGADVGAAFGAGYGGGLALALTSGMRAGVLAAESSLRPRSRDVEIN